jgi:hypothetical protein
MSYAPVQAQGQIMYNAYASSAPGAAPTIYGQPPAAMIPGALPRHADAYHKLRQSGT